MNKTYRITNSQKNGFLTAFHSNGGWKIGDVFPFSVTSWITFDNEKKAQEYIMRIVSQCKEQEERWGQWTETALKFANKLYYTTHNQ